MNINTPEIFGVPTANVALAVSLINLLSSPFWVALFVALRDRADVRIELRYGNVFLPNVPGTNAGPFVTIKASNRGRRPVTLNTYGITFSNGTAGVFPPYPMTPLPKRVEESESYAGFIPLRSLQEAVRSNPARLTSFYFDANDGRRFRRRIWRWSSWHKRLKEGDVAPEVSNDVWMDPGRPLRQYQERQRKQQL